jgi:hypothetical protein
VFDIGATDEKGTAQSMADATRFVFFASQISPYKLQRLRRWYGPTIANHRKTFYIRQHKTLEVLVKVTGYSTWGYPQSRCTGFQMILPTFLQAANAEESRRQYTDKIRAWDLWRNVPGASHA